MKHGVSKWLILCSNCTKTHLRASVDQKNFLGSLSLAMRGGKKRKGEGGGVRGRGRGGDNGIMGGEGKDRGGEAGGEGTGEGVRGGERGKEGREGNGTPRKKPSYGPALHSPLFQNNNRRTIKAF
jgi:hypothetical protein